MKEDKILLSRTTHPDLNISSSDFLSVNYSPDYKWLMLELWGGAQEQTRRFFAAASDLEKAQIKWNPLTRPEDQARLGHRVLGHEAAVEEDIRKAGVRTVGREHAVPDIATVEADDAFHIDEISDARRRDRRWLVEDQRGPRRRRERRIGVRLQ